MSVDSLRILVIDDERLRWFGEIFSNRPPKELTLVATPEEGLRELRSHTYDLLFLDHDLQSKVDGSGILSEVFWNPDSYFPPRKVWTHSENPLGRQNIVSKCRSAGVEVKSLGFGQFYLSPEVFWQEFNTYFGIHGESK